MAAGYAWFLVLGSVFLCNLMKTLLPSISSFVSIYYNALCCFGRGLENLLSYHNRQEDTDSEARCFISAHISWQLGGSPAKT